VSADFEALAYRLLRLNPCVAIHELRLRMRGGRAFWVLFAYATIAAGTFLLAMWLAVWMSDQSSAGGAPRLNFGRIILSVVTYTQLVLLLLVLPAYSAGSITMEREKRTLDMLRATLLTASDVVSGKFLVVLGLGLILLLTSLPIGAWSLLLGGVAPEEVFYLYTYLFALGALATALGMFYSTLLGRSVGAMVATYGTLLALIIVPLILMPIIFIAIVPGGPAVGLGDIWGAIFLTATALVCGWLFYLAFRWLWRRLLGERLFFVSHALPALAVTIGLVLLLRPGSPALTWAAAVRAGWVFLLEPFVTLAALLEGGDFAGMFLGVSGGGGGNAQFLIWAGCTAAMLLGTALCWAAAIRVYRVRR